MSGQLTVNCDMRGWLVVIMELPEVTEIFARLNYTRHPCMHGASSGLGLISLDLAGVCLYVQL